MRRKGHAKREGRWEGRIRLPHSYSKGAGGMPGFEVSDNVTAGGAIRTTPSPKKEPPRFLGAATSGGRKIFTHGALGKQAVTCYLPA
jgi:hypothetical protein